MKYLRRLIWYAGSRLLVLLCVLGLMTTAFYFSMNATNIYIIVKDGMAKRAQVILTGADDRLDAYFSASYLDRDTQYQEALTGQNVYQRYYSIKGFDHRISLDSFWCWPWEDSARATVTERIPAIDGKLRVTARDAAQNGLSAVPKWQSAQYSVLLSRENGQWHIRNLTVTRIVTEE